MASYEFIAPTEAFPAGQDVAVYAESDWATSLYGLPPRGAPPGSEVTTGTLSATRRVTFTGLDDGAPYFVAGLVGSEWRYVGFETPPVLSQAVETARGVIVPAPTGIAATDTANLLAAIAQTVTLWGTGGGPVFLRPGTYVINASLVLPRSGSLIGAGSGGLSGTGGSQVTTIDATAITTGRAIDFGSTGGNFQVVERLRLEGPAAESAVVSKYGGSVGVYLGYFAQSPVARDMFIRGFSNQITGEHCHDILITNVFGKRSGVHGVAVNGGSGSYISGTIRDSLFADGGLNPAVVTATHRPGNILVEEAEHFLIDTPLVDESFNGSSGITICGASKDCEIRCRQVYSDRSASGCAIRIGDGTNAVVRTKVAAHVAPYMPSGPTAVGRGLIISALAEDTEVNITTEGFTTAGYEFVDGGTRTRIVTPALTTPGIPRTSLDPPPSVATYVATGGANRAVFMRAVDTGTVANVVLHVDTSSGNICVALCTGPVGRANPSSRVATSGSIPCPAAGAATISLGASVPVGSRHWFALAADNATATFLAKSATSAFSVTNAGLGFGAYQDSAFPIPASPAPTAGFTPLHWMVGA